MAEVVTVTRFINGRLGRDAAYAAKNYLAHTSYTWRPISSICETEDA